MSSFGFFLTSPSKKTSAIILIARINKCRFKKSIGVSCGTQYWNKDKQRCNGSRAYMDGIVVNHKIDQYDIAVKKVMFDIGMEVLPGPIDLADFSEMLNSVIEGREYDKSRREFHQYTFSEYFKKIFIARMAKTKTVERIQRLSTLLHVIKRFEESSGRIYSFKEIDLVFYRDLQSFMFKQNYSPNYFGAVIKVVKQVMREAKIVDKIHTNDQYELSDFVVIDKGIDSVYLTPDELKRLSDLVIDEQLVNTFYPTSRGEMLKTRIHTYNVVRNKFLIGAYTGLRVSDYNNIKSADISNGKITVLTQKTKQKIIIPIHPIVQGIIDQGFDVENQITDQKLNYYIKHLCQYVNIDELIMVSEFDGGIAKKVMKPKYSLVVTHTARRSFATNAYYAGIPPVSIMRITGHTKESTFMKYICIDQEENANLLAEHDFFKK